MSACAKTWTGLWTVDYGLCIVDCGLCPSFIMSGGGGGVEVDSLGTI